MVGAVQGGQTPLNVMRCNPCIARNDRAVIKLHHQRRVLLAPIGVNHQTAEVTADHGAVQRSPQSHGQSPRADIHSDVARHILG